MAPSLPPAKDIRDLFEGLLGRDIQVAPCDPPATASCAALGLYVSDHERMTAVVCLDLPLAARVGTSIALIPPGGADAAIEDGVLTPAVLDNVAETLNVLAGVLNQHSDVHQRLFATYRGVAEAPGDAAALAAAVGNRLDLTVDIQKYGPGVLSCILV